MPGLDRLAQRMQERARQLDEAERRILVEVAVTADQAVVLATPVDTGRARGGWNVSVGAPDFTVPPVDEVDPGGQNTITRNTGAIRTRRPGQTIFLQNNVEYIGRLNEGSSSQAPASFVQMAVISAIRALRRTRVFR